MVDAEYVGHEKRTKKDGIDCRESGNYNHSNHNDSINNNNYNNNNNNNKKNLNNYYDDRGS